MTILAIQLATATALGRSRYTSLDTEGTHKGFVLEEVPVGIRVVTPRGESYRVPWANVAAVKDQPVSKRKRDGLG